MQVDNKDKERLLHVLTRYLLASIPQWPGAWSCHGDDFIIDNRVLTYLLDKLQPCSSLSMIL